MSAANPTHPSAASAESFLIGLKQHAVEVFEKLQTAASSSAASSARKEELELWDCVRRNILDDSSARKTFVEVLRKERKYNASKDEVLRLEKLIATLSAGGAQVDDIEMEKMELQELQHAETVALDDLRPVKLSLLKSVLACTVCSLGTETQPNVVFEAHFEKARLLPKDQDPHKFMTGVMKEAMSVCWKAHGVTADRQAALENDLAKFDEDADFKLLRPASKWQTARCLKEFKTLPSSKPAPSKVDRSAKGPGAAAESKVPYSPYVTLADVKGPIEQKLGDEKLSVAVMITCDKLEAGCAIRLKADDCVVGGHIAYFLKQDGKSKQKEAVCNDCVTLVLDVIYQPGLLVSEKPHTEIRITAFEDDDHSRWYKAMMMLDELRKAANPWVEQVMQDMWRDLKQELLDGSSKEDGSTLAASIFPHFPVPKDDGSYSFNNATVNPTASEVLWFEAIMNRHADPSNTKVTNSQLKLWADPAKGYVEVMKLFCNTLGGHDASKNKRRVEDLDAEAVFKIIFNCKAFHGAVGPANPLNPVKAAANGAGVARNSTIHAPTPNLSAKDFDAIVGQLSLFEKMLVQHANGVVGAGSCIIRNMKWMEVNLADEKLKENIKLYERIKELRNKQLQHDILDQLLLPRSNVCGDRHLLLQAAEESVLKLQNDWAPGTREALKRTVISHIAAGNSRVKLVWLHAQRGRGKSSVMAQLAKPSEWSPDTRVLRHFFKRDDAASSLNIAAASMCVQLWHHFFPHDMEAAYTLFDNCMLASDGASLDVHELSAALNRQSLARIIDDVLVQLLKKIDGSVSAPVSVVMQFDALDEVTHRRLQADGSALPADPTANFQNPHLALHSDIFGRLLAQAPVLQNIHVVIVASSTQSWFGAASPFIHQIPVDSDAFLPAEDAHSIVAHKINTYWPKCNWTADVVTICCRLVSRKSPDLRFLDTRIKLVIESAKKWMQSAAVSAAGGPMPAEVEDFLKSLVERTGDMSLVQVVQVYLFQEMHFAFPDADLADWENRVSLVFDALVLAAFFGAYSFRTDLFHPLVCSAGQTLESFETLLKDAASSIMLSSPCDGQVALQPEYMDAFRSSAATSGGFSNVRDVMDLVYSGRRRGSTEPNVMSWADKLEQRFRQSKCFDRMSQCFASATDLTERGLRILSGHACSVGKLVDLHEELFFLMTRQYVRTSCPCAVQCILQAMDRRVGGSDSSPDLKFYRGVCEQLRNCLSLDRCSGLLQYRAAEVASETAKYLQQRLFCVEGDAGRQIARLIKSHSKATYLFDMITFLRLHSSDFNLVGTLSQTSSLLEVGFVPAKLRIFLCAVRSDPSQSSVVELIMRESGLNETDIWNVRSMSTYDVRERLVLLSSMKEAGIEQDGFTRSIIMLSHKSDRQIMEALMKESQEIGITPNNFDWNTLMSGYRTGEERDAVLQRMVDAGVTPDLVSWNTLMQGFSKDRLPMHCLVCFCRMLQAKVPSDSFTFSFLFTCLVSDCRDEHCLRTVVHIASLRIVSRLMVNHFVATPVLSALASVGVNNDILSFWQFCGRHLSRSKEGWPGQETHENLSRRCRKNRGSGWALLLALLEGRHSAEGAPVWPPKDAPPATDMMKEAVLRAAQYRAPTSSIVIGGSAAVGKNGHATRSPSPPASAAAVAACRQGAAASISSRSMTCRDCRCEFEFSVADQAYYQERGYPDPVRCPQCREANKAKKNAPPHSAGGGSSSSRGGRGGSSRGGRGGSGSR